MQLFAVQLQGGHPTSVAGHVMYPRTTVIKVCNAVQRRHGTLHHPKQSENP